MKPHLPLPLFLLLTTTALGLTTTVVDEDFWTKAAQAINESLTLLLESDISTGGTYNLVVNSDLTVTVPNGTAASLHIDTSRGGVIVNSGKTAAFTGLKNVRLGGTATGSRMGAAESGLPETSWPITGGVFIGESARMDISGNSGSVSNSGNGFSSSERSSSVGAGGAAYFVAKGGTLNLNDNAGGVAVNNNYVTAGGTATAANGAGIYAYTDAQVNICGNAGVSLSNNGVSSAQNSASGAAIYAHQSAIVNISNNSGTVDISNNSATTTSTSQVYGGAIGMAGGTQLIIADNEAVTITGNRATTNGSGANAWGGAIRVDNLLSITGNHSVLFDDNRAQTANGQVQGGAIRNSSGRGITISGNGSVRFLDNAAVTADSTKTTTNRMGGAIYSGADLSLCDNGELIFSGNSIRTGVTAVNRWNALGGAIYAAMGLNISGNDSVVFEKNYEQRGSSIVLRGIYQRSASNVQLQLSAKEGGSIIFREALYSELTHANARAVFNGSYDAASDTYTRTGSGDIIFSGATTKADLNALRSERGMAAAAWKDINASLSSEINEKAALLGGSLRVEDGVSLYFSDTLTVYEGATLALSRGAQLMATDITMAGGTTLSLAGAANYLTADTFSMGAGSLVSLTLDAAQMDEAALTLINVDVSAGLLSGITLELDGLQAAESGSYKLFTIWGTEDITTYDTSTFTLRGEGVNPSAFRWDAGEQTLFFDYVAPPADIIVDNGTGTTMVDAPTTSNLILKHGCASIGEGGALSGKVIFTEEAADTARTLVLATEATLVAVELQATGGNTINVEADTATVLSLSGSGSLDKAGDGTLVLSGSESRVQGELAVQSGRVQLQDGASVSGDSIILGSRGRAAVTAEIVTDTLSITPVNGIGSILNHADISSDGTELGGTAETPAQFDNILLRLTQETAYTLSEAVLSGSRVELTESGATLQAADLVMDSTSALLAAEGASITLSGDNALVVGAANMGTTQHQGLTFNLLQSDQLDGVTLAASGSLQLDLGALTSAPSPYVAIFFKGLSSAAAEEALSLSSGYRLMEADHAASGLTLYMAQTPEPTIPTLFLCALGGIFRRRRA